MATEFKTNDVAADKLDLELSLSLTMPKIAQNCDHNELEEDEVLASFIGRCRNEQKHELPKSITLTEFADVVANELDLPLSLSLTTPEIDQDCDHSELEEHRVLASFIKKCRSKKNPELPKSIMPMEFATDDVASDKLDLQLSLSLTTPEIDQDCDHNELQEHRVLASFIKQCRSNKNSELPKSITPTEFAADDVSDDKLDLQLSPSLTKPEIDQDCDHNELEEHKQCRSKQNPELPKSSDSDDEWKIKKVLTVSDVNNNDRLMLSNKDVENHILGLLTDKNKVDLCKSKFGGEFEILDDNDGSIHRLRLKKHTESSGSFVFICNWKKNFVKRKGLEKGDTIGISCVSNDKIVLKLLSKGQLRGS